MPFETLFHEPVYSQGNQSLSNGLDESHLDSLPLATSTNKPEVGEQGTGKRFGYRIEGINIKVIEE